MTSPSTATFATKGSTWVQTERPNFYHNFTGTEKVYEQVPDVPTLTIPFSGLWQLSYSARTNIGWPAGSSGQAAIYVTTALFNNGVAILGTEALTGKVYNPGESSQDTIGQTFLYQFDAGDAVTLHGYRIGPQGGGVLSDPNGRTGITAHWVSPGF